MKICSYIVFSISILQKYLKRPVTQYCLREAECCLTAEKLLLYHAAAGRARKKKKQQLVIVKRRQDPSLQNHTVFVASLQVADEKAAAETAAVAAVLRLDKRQLSQTCRTTLELDLDIEFDKHQKCRQLLNAQSWHIIIVVEGCRDTHLSLNCNLAAVARL